MKVVVNKRFAVGVRRCMIECPKIMIKCEGIH